MILECEARELQTFRSNVVRRPHWQKNTTVLQSTCKSFLARETRDKCRLDGPLGSHVDFTQSYVTNKKTACNKVHTESGIYLCNSIETQEHHLCMGY